MQAALRFTSQAVELLRREIAEAGGNEVFALGGCDGDGLVEALRITARGNEGMVPALQLDLAHTDDERPFDVFIHNHPSGFLTPSDNDLLIAARAAESGIGAYIVDNKVSKVYVVAEPVRRRQRTILDPDKLCAALEQNGAIARRLARQSREGRTGYERREAQLDLVRLIVRAFNEDTVVAAEAGTGVGKSFAYLLPVLEFALGGNERIVISTATITLQQQLYEKDIPLVLSALRKKVKCCLVKGRGNYLCRRRLAEAQLEPPLDDAEYEELRSVSSWAEQTGTGSRSDLSFLPSAQLWSRLCCESDACPGMRCAERERCFFMALRRESSDARILVVNHHLLFADLAARHEGAGYESAVVLPPYTRVIIDEAHTIESAATSFFSKGWSRQGIGRALSRLYRKRRALETGLLLRIAALLPAAPGASGASNPPGTPGASGSLAAIIKAHKAVREGAEEADAAALAICGNEGLFRFVPGGNRADTRSRHPRQGGMAEHDPLGELRQPLEKLRKAIETFTGKVRTLVEPVELTVQEDPSIWEVKAILRRLDSASSICDAFLEFGLNPEDDSEVFWLERQGRNDPWAAFTVTPVNIAPSLKEALFEANKTVVCVSATLSTGRKTGGGSERTDDDWGGHDAGKNKAFHYWAERTGAALADRDFLCGLFPSPFPYAERTLLAVPVDAPLPDSPDFQAFTGKAVTELVRIAGGSALILFTSYQALQNTWDEAAPALENEGIRCLKQGDDDRTRLLQRFLEDRNSVLFGTDSFWEGVDAPGETLRLLILCRLPFKTMKDPVFEARREFLEKRGRNSFMELSLPDAVMKFKQGFGRLMRSSSDYGAVIVLDGRILRKYYGTAFLGSLPETKTSFRELNEVLSDLERFLY